MRYEVFIIIVIIIIIIPILQTRYWFREAALLKFTHPGSSGTEMYIPTIVGINNIGNITGPGEFTVIFLIDNLERLG